MNLTFPTKSWRVLTAGYELAKGHGSSTTGLLKTVQGRGDPPQIAAGVQGDDPAALRARIAELEKQLRRTEMEREILKK